MNSSKYLLLQSFVNLAAVQIRRALEFDAEKLLDSPEEQKERARLFKEARKNLVEGTQQMERIQNESAEKYDDECTMSRAQTCVLRGEIAKYFDQDLADCKKQWEAALVIYTDNPAAKGELTTLVDNLESLYKEIDGVGFMLEKLRLLDTADSKEKASVQLTFGKYDEDKSGSIDLLELSKLATDLGAYPPLSEGELHEAKMQLDQSLDGQVSFDEFWTWWMSQDERIKVDERSTRSAQ